MPFKIAPGLPWLASLCLVGLLVLLVPGPLWGQGREPCGGHAECSCDVCRKKREGVKKDEPRKLPQRYHGGARVITAHQVQLDPVRHLPHEMGFRPPAAKPAKKSRIDQAAERARLRREAREQKAAPMPPRALADLRLGAAAFRRADYEEAVTRFKSAAAAVLADAAPLFALGQAHIALGRDGRAARVIRQAVRLHPELLRSKRAIARAFGEPVEFDRVMEALESRAAAVPSNADSKFVLAVQRYFTGDERSRETFAWLSKAVPDDEVAALFVSASIERFGVKRKSNEAGTVPDRALRDETR